MVTSSRRGGRGRLLIAVLVLLALTLITLSTRGSGNATLRSARSDVRSVVTPVDSAVHDVLRPIGNFVNGALDYGNLEAENQRLRDELARQSALGIENQYLVGQNAQILALQHIPWAGSYQTVVAKVVSQPVSNFEETVTIDKGTASGIAVGQPVMSAAGLAGQVSAVGSSTAVVTLITDPSFTVGVSLPNNNVASAKGQGQGQAMAVTLDSTAQTPPVVKVGAPISTSGLYGEVFPQGIPVGRVASVTKPAGALEPTLTIKPFTDTADLGYVSVMLWSPQTTASGR